jgi:mono/diheme cytochrome c family protein
MVAATLTGVWATLLSAGTPQSAASHADAAGIFKDRCQVCHGADGSGTTVGKSLQITDLRSDKVQQQPDSSLSQAIREGKNNMPSFGSSLDGARVGELVSFIRGLKAKTSAATTIPASVAGTARVKRNPSQEQRDWAVWGGNAENNHYSALTQINRNNVKQLAVAWSFDSQEEGGLQTSPIVAESVLYGITPTQKIFALDAATGKLFWKFDSGIKGTQPDRGLAYWTDGKRQAHSRRSDELCLCAGCGHRPADCKLRKSWPDRLAGESRSRALHFAVGLHDQSSHDLQGFVDRRWPESRNLTFAARRRSRF